MTTVLTLPEGYIGCCTVEECFARTTCMDYSSGVDGCDVDSGGCTSCSDPATPHCFTITNILAKQHILYCNNVPGTVTTSYLNPITSGSHANYPPSTSYNPSSSTSETTTTTTEPTSSVSSTVQSAQPAGFSAGGIAGIAIGAFFAGLLVISMAIIFIFLPLIRKRRKGVIKHPRGTLGGAVLPDSWSGNDKDRHQNKPVKHEAFMGSGRTSSQLHHHKQSKNIYGGREQGFVDPSQSDGHPAWDPQDYNRARRDSELADTSFVRPKLELESRQGPQSPSLRKHRSTLRGSPYMWQSTTTELASNSDRSLGVMSNQSQSASNSELDSTQRPGSRSCSSSDLRMIVGARQTGSGDGLVIERRAQDGIDHQFSADPSQRPQSGFVSDFTSSPPSSTGFELSPPTMQGPFPADSQPHPRRHPSISRTTSAPTTQHPLPFQGIAPGPQSSVVVPTIRISTFEGPDSYAVQSQGIQESPDSHRTSIMQSNDSGTQPSRQSARYPYENRPPTPHAFPLLSTVTGGPRANIRPDSPNHGNGRDSFSRSLPSSTSTSDPPTSKDPSSSNMAPAVATQTSRETSESERERQGSAQREVGEGLSASGPWEGYVTAEQAIQGAFWDEERRRAGKS